MHFVKTQLDPTPALANLCLLGMVLVAPNLAFIALLRIRFFLMRTFATVSVERDVLRVFIDYLIIS